MATPIPDFLVLSPSLAAKLAAAVVHADEFVAAGGGHPFDFAALQAAVREGDKDKWAEDSWKEELKLHRTAWKVVKIEHVVRRTDISITHCTTWVYVKKVKA